MTGTVKRVFFGSLKKVLDDVHYRLILPRTKSREEAEATIHKNLGDCPAWIAFEIVLDAR